MNYQQKRYIRLKAAGICVKCGKNKAVPGQIHCPYCKIAVKEYNRRANLKIDRVALSKKQREQYKEEGRCPRCSAILPEGSVNIQCQYCTERLYENNKFRKGIDFTQFYPGGQYENYNQASA